VTQVVHVEREVTKVVTEIVRQTVIVEETAIVERTVEKVVTASPASPGRAVIVADLLDYGWTQFAMLMSAPFEAMFPSIAIRWRSLSTWGEYLANVTTRQASGTPSDLLEAPIGSLLGRWIEEGVTQPLDDLVEEAKLETDDLLGGVLEACRHQGQLAGVPFVAHGGENLLLYDRQALSDAELPYPRSDWTLITLGLTAGQFMSAQSGTYGYGPRSEMPGSALMLRVFGGELLNASGTACALGSGPGRAYLDWLVDSIRGRNPIAPHAWQVPQGLRSMMRDGKLAMMRADLDTVVQFERAASGEPWVGATVFPTLAAGDVHAALPSGVAYAVGAGSKVAREAVQWLKYISGQEMGVQMFVSGCWEPGAQRACWSDDGVLQRFPAAALVAESLDAAQPEPLAHNYRDGQCHEVWNAAVRALLEERITVDACLDAIREGVDRVLGEPRQALVGGRIGR